MKNLIYKQLLIPLNGRVFCLVFNFLEIFKKSRARRCTYLSSSDVYLLDDGVSSMVFSRPSRIYRLMDGVKEKIEALYFAYTGGLVNIKPNDLVIDCGANIGEFSLYCAGRGATVHAFEPDPVEFRALSANANHRFSAYNTALWKDDAGITLFSANDTGDSSVFPRKEASQSFNIGSQTLNYFVLNSLKCDKPGKNIKLLKLEAEGAEPEILSGALDILDRVSYIAADLGPERGDDNENTVPVVVNILIEHGFRIVFFNPSRSIFLFKNLLHSDQF